MPKDYDSSDAFGAGSYPEPPTSKYKCFSFEAEVVSKVKGYVYAENTWEAEALINSLRWEEIENEAITEVIDIESVEEE